MEISYWIIHDGVCICYYDFYYIILLPKIAVRHNWLRPILN